MSAERSQRSGSASSASISGRAIASPVMSTEFTPCSWNVSHTPSALNWRTITSVDPRNHWLSVAICAAPCMSGGMMQNTSGVSLAAACSERKYSFGTRSPVVASMPWPSAKKMSSLRHITPFGMPVVPPV